MQGTYLVNAGVPHTVRTIEKERYCISIVLGRDRKSISMPIALEIFADLLN